MYIKLYWRRFRISSCHKFDSSIMPMFFKRKLWSEQKNMEEITNLLIDLTLHGKIYYMYIYSISNSRILQRGFLRYVVCATTNIEFLFCEILCVCVCVCVRYLSGSMHTHTYWSIFSYMTIYILIALLYFTLGILQKSI